MDKKKQTLIWQLTTEGVAQQSYLIGTMHVSHDKAFALEEKFKAIIRQTDAFATEFNLDEVDEKAITEAMQLPFNTDLKSVLGIRGYNKTKNILSRQLGLNIHFFDYQKPIAITNVLTETILAGNRMYALDQALWEFAKENGRQLRGIETFEEQISILKKLSIEEQAETVKGIARSFSRFRKQLFHLSDLYEKEDIQKLYQAGKKSLKSARAVLLYRRNHVMAERIHHMMHEGQSYCFAIGAAHLWGEKGVLRYLKLRGIIIKPILL